MFSDNPPLKIAFRDTRTEKELLHIFHDWCGKLGKKEETGGVLAKHSHDLYILYDKWGRETEIGNRSLAKEYKSVMETLSALAKWEDDFLDNDQIFRIRLPSPKGF